MIRLSTYDLLKPILDSISKTFIVKEITDNGDGTYTITTCDTLWLQPDSNNPLTINGKEYYVEDIEPDQWIKVSGTTLPVAETFEIYDFHPFNGTVLSNNQRLKAIEDFKEKYPMIWVHSVTREKINDDPKSSIDRVSDIDLYIMTHCDFEQWENDDHQKYAIRPMRNLLEKVIDAIKETSGLPQPMNNTEVYDHLRFGTFVNSKGEPTQMFSDFMSGVNLKTSVTFRQNVKACACP